MRDAPIRRGERRPSGRPEGLSVEAVTLGDLGELIEAPRRRQDLDPDDAAGGDRDAIGLAHVLVVIDPPDVLEVDL